MKTRLALLFGFGLLIAARADLGADLASLRALLAERTDRARSGQTFSAAESVRWLNDHSNRVAESALAAYENNPADPRRWEAALIALQTLRGFVLEVKPGYDEAIAARDVAKVQSLLVRDEAARTAWDQRMDALQTALFAAPDVPPAVLAEAYGNAVYRATLRRGATPAERWARVQPLLDAMAQRVTDGTQLTRALELGARLLSAADPAAYPAFLQAQSQSPLPAVSAWATGKANVQAAKVQAVEMKFTALDGREVDVAQLRGKVVLIDFWATWCGPCKEELPNILATYRQYHERGFEVVAVSLDSTKDRAKLVDYVREHALPWPQHFDGLGWKNEFAAKFGIRAIPAMFLLDQSGKVVSTDARGPRLEKEVRRLLDAGEPPAAPAVATVEAPPRALLAAGALAPDFVSFDLLGQPVKISDYRGKILILDFWATWCGPCIASMPHTQAIAQRYADQGVVALAVATGDKRKAFEDWVKLKAASYPALRFAFDPHEKGTPAEAARASFALYGVPAIPTQFVIDREGRVAGTTSGYVPGDSSLERALAAAGVKVDAAALAQTPPSSQVRASAEGAVVVTMPSGPSAPPAANAPRRAAPPFTDKVAKLAAGDVLPDVSFRTADGTPRQLSAYRGHPLILFFSTVEMIPADYLDGLVAKYGAEGVQVLALVTRDTEANFNAWQALHRPRGHTFGLAFDPVPVATPTQGVVNRIFQFGAPTPFAIVVDADGKFVGMFPWKLPQGQEGLSELLRRCGVVGPSAAGH